MIICAVLALVLGYVGSAIHSGTGGASTAAAATSPSESWVSAVKKRGELRVGVAVSPPLVVQSGKNWSGPYLLPMKNLAKALGVKFVPVGTTYANIVSGLQAGQYDAAAALDLTIPRAMSIQYTAPLMSETKVFVKKKSSSYNTAASINATNLPVAVPTGTTQESAIQQLGKKPLSLDSYSDALQAVDSGRAAATFAGLGTAVQQVKSDSSLAIVVPSTDILTSVSGYGVPQNIDASSLSLIDIAINDSISSGSFNAALTKAGYVTLDNLGSLEK
ncbi:MAG: hypothetical protein JWP75_1626 [Frondihabitans sp.]|nr:hypothetical protein [Frondihabitans sp.]